MKKRCFDQVSPACAILTAQRHRFACLRCFELLERSLDLLAASFLLRCAPTRAGAAGPVRTRASLRFSAFRSPESIG